MHVSLELHRASVAVWNDFCRLGAQATDESRTEANVRYTFDFCATQAAACAAQVRVHVHADVGSRVAKVVVETPQLTVTSEDDLAYFGDVVHVACEAAHRARITLDCALCQGARCRRA